MLSKFLHFCAFVQNHFNSGIKIIQCDNGGEFNNNQFQNICDQNDIKMCFSYPYTSQQNGKSECMIRIIDNIGRTLLLHARLPSEYWVEALHMAERLLNILPSITLHNNTRFHKLYKKIPTYTHLCVFGCLCFPNVVEPHKISPRSTPSIFLGYPTNHKGYRCLDLQTKKTIIFHHVFFDEYSFPFCSLTPNSAPSQSLLNYIAPFYRNVPHLYSPIDPSDQSPNMNIHTPQPTDSSVHPHDSSAQTTDLIPNLSYDQPFIVVLSITSSQPVATSLSQHPMLTRLKNSVTKYITRLNLHVDSSSPIPKSYLQAFEVQIG